MKETYKIWSDSCQSVPTVYLHSFADDGEGVWRTCHEMNCPPFNLVSVHGIDLDAALTPWPAPGVRRGQPPFGGKADEHLEELLHVTMPEVERQLEAPSSYQIMAGYSLAGLFALWSVYRTDAFRRFACVSGSLWYPDFFTFLQTNELKAEPECCYFSLGDKEAQTRHPLMSKVNVCTQEAYEIIRNKGISTCFEWNPGNHFTAPNERMAKAIRWVLEHK